MKTVKIENQVKETLLAKIAETKKGKVAEISGTKNINAIKKIAEELKIKVSENYEDVKDAGSDLIVIYNPIGEWNGYGYDKYPKEAIFPKTKIKNFLNKKSETKKATKKLTEEEKTEKWAKRLEKLTDITFEDAMKIAEEKIDYKEEKINEMYNRQFNTFSQKREKLIEKMERENPLRRIEDTEHAERIVAAHIRHTNTDYEMKLEEGRELADFGEIDKSEVREYARCNFS